MVQQKKIKVFDLFFLLFLMLLPLTGRISIKGTVSMNILFACVLITLLLIKLSINKKFYFRYDKKLVFLIFIFIILNILSYFFAHSKMLFFTEIKAFIVPILIVFLLTIYIQSEKELLRVINVLFYSGFIVSIVTIIQMIIIINTLGYKGVGVLGNPNYFSGIVACLFPIASYKLINNKINIFNIIIYSTYILAIIISFSKTAWISGIITVIYFSMSKKPKKILFTIIVFIFIWLVMSNVSNYLNFESILLKTIEGFNATSRKILLMVSMKIIKNNFIFGVGLGNYPLHTYNYSYMYKNYYPGSVSHNIFTDILSETGIINFIIFIFILHRVIKNITYKRNFIQNNSLKKVFLLSFFLIILYTSTHGSGRTFYYLWIWIAIGIKVRYLYMEKGEIGYVKGKNKTLDSDN